MEAQIVHYCMFETCVEFLLSPLSSFLYKWRGLRAVDWNREPTRLNIQNGLLSLEANIEGAMNEYTFCSDAYDVLCAIIELTDDEFIFLISNRILSV